MDTFLGIPLNRVVAFAGPYISAASGAVATWLLVHVHLLGLFHLRGDSLAKFLTQAAIFGFVSGLTWLGHSKWLTGHHIELGAAATAAASAAARPPEQHV